MKKYSKPETKIITVATTKMIAASVGFNNTAVNANEAQSRGNRSSWDDDEE